MYYVLPKKNYETKIFSICLKMFADGMASANLSKIDRFWVSKSHKSMIFMILDRKIHKNINKIHYIVICNVWNVSETVRKWSSGMWCCIPHNLDIHINSENNFKINKSWNFPSETVRNWLILGPKKSQIHDFHDFGSKNP